MILTLAILDGDFANSPYGHRLCYHTEHAITIGDQRVALVEWGQDDCVAIDPAALLSAIASLELQVERLEDELDNTLGKVQSLAIDLDAIKE